MKQNEGRNLTKLAKQNTNLSIEDNKYIILFNLSHQKLQPEDLPPLFQQFNRQRAIKQHTEVHLKLNNNIHLKSRAAKLLLNIGDWKQLSVLNLKMNQIGEKRVHYLTKNQWGRLQQLNLQNTHIGPASCKKLVKMDCKHLKKLNLKYCNLGQKGCFELAKATWDLTELDVNNNLILKKGYSFLAKYWKVLLCQKKFRTM